MKNSTRVPRCVVGAVALVLAVTCLPMRGWAQPFAIRVTSGGLALTTSHAVGRTPPGGTVSGMVPPSRLVVQDVAAGWAIVQNLDPTTGDDALLVLREQPRPQQRVRVEWPGVTRDGIVEQSTPSQLVVRFLQLGPAATPEGAAVVDTNRRLVGVVMRADATRAMAIPASLAVSDLRSAAEPVVVSPTVPTEVPRRPRLSTVTQHHPALSAADAGGSLDTSVPAAHAAVQGPGDHVTEPVRLAVEEAPGVPPSAVAELGAPGGAFAVHVGSDAVYATLANRLHDVATGCLVRAPGYLHGEVLGVDEVANVAVFHVVAASPPPDAPSSEDAPLVLVDTRPSVGRPVRAVVNLTDRDPLPMATGTVTDAHGDDLLVDFDPGLRGSTPRLVQGSPVIDGDGRVVGLIDRVVVGRRYRVRSAAAIRRLLVTIRRETSTSMCFPAFGATQGFVTSIALQLGVEGGTMATQGSQYNFTAGVFWYNTWYFRGELGLRLSDAPMPRISLAGGPLVFRTAGDGEVGVGLHIELDAGLAHTQGRAALNGAQRVLYAFEVHGMPYVTNHFGLIFALAMGVAQYGDLTESAYGFGLTYSMGVVFGSLRHDRP